MHEIPGLGARSAETRNLLAERTDSRLVSGVLYADSRICHRAWCRQVRGRNLDPVDGVIDLVVGSAVAEVDADPFREPLDAVVLDQQAVGMAAHCIVDFGQKVIDSRILPKLLLRDRYPVFQASNGNDLVVFNFDQHIVG